ncbi:MAG: hypothetical protein HY928_16955 [Elusimicrobia bacterium]|nr:hypothetical protein [Elusimicrobiota bacterium]
MTFAAARQERAGLPAALLGALLALTAIRLRAHARPELATLLLLPLFLWSARASEEKSWALAPLPLLSLFWTNMHGGWVLGPAILGAAGVGRAWRLRDGRHPAALRLWGASLACFAASFLNPYGTRMHAVVLEHALHPPAAAGIEEWSSAALVQFPAFWLLLAGVLVRLALDLRRNKRESLYWLCLLAPFAVLGLSGARFAPFFCLVAPAYLFSGLADLPPSRALRWGLPAAGLALVLGMAPPLFARDWESPVRWERTPRQALEFLEREGVEGTLFNDYGFGGFIDWSTSGRRPVYYDGRYLFQGLLAEAAAAAEDPAAFQALMDRRVVTYALVPLAHAPVQGPDGTVRSPWKLRFPAEHWALVWSDDAAQVFVRREERYAGLIARTELRYADPADADFVLAQVRAGSWSADAVRAEAAGLPGAAGKALASLFP